MSGVTNNRALSPSPEGPSVKRAKTERASPPPRLSSSSSSSSSSIQPSSAASYAAPSSPLSPQTSIYRNFQNMDRYIERLVTIDITAENLSEIKGEMNRLLADIDPAWSGFFEGRLYKAYGIALHKSLQKERNPTVMIELLDCLKKHARSGAAIGEQLRLQADCFATCQTFPDAFLEPFRPALKNPKDLYRMALEKFHEYGNMTIRDVAQNMHAIEYALNPDNRHPIPIYYLELLLTERTPDRVPSSLLVPFPPLPLITRTTESLPRLEGPPSRSLPDPETSPALGISDAVDRDLSLLYGICGQLKVEEIPLVKKKISEIANKLTRMEKAIVYYSFAKALLCLYKADQTNVSINIEIIECFKQARRFAYGTNDARIVARIECLTARLYGIIYHFSPRDDYHAFALRRFEEAMRHRPALQADETNPTKRAQIEDEFALAQQDITYLNANPPLVRKTNQLIERLKTFKVEQLIEVKAKIAELIGKLPPYQMTRLYYSYTRALIRLYCTNKTESLFKELNSFIEVTERFARDGRDKYVIGKVLLLKAVYYNEVLGAETDVLRTLVEQAKKVWEEGLKEHPQRAALLTPHIEDANRRLFLLGPADATPLSLSASISPSTHYMRGLFAERTNRAKALKHYRAALPRAVGPLKASIEAAIARLS